jgi:NAD-dependent dihydropyrimidine dehydrogenase PreA subunit/flavodoxin
MVFYFSGTGNSLYVAKNIAINQGEELISISKEMKQNKGFYEYDLKLGEKIIFVYPIYAWSSPAPVVEFISKLKLSNYRNNYLTAVVTCGENIGNNMNILNKELNGKGLKLNSGFSITMPNNYIILGKADEDDIAELKISKALEMLGDVNNLISNKVKDVLKIEKGPMPKIMTAIANPIFNKMAINTKKFHVTDACIGCKLCEQVCNTKCIKVDKVPEWGNNCCQCLACISYCPKEAIQYGKWTIGKKKYRNPKIAVNEMNI